MELALRLTWLNSNGGKRRGVKSKEKAGANAGISANVFWRKRGCVNWWNDLDAEIRNNLLQTLLRKAAKVLINEIIKEANHAIKDESCVFIVGAERKLKYYSTLFCQRNALFLSGSDADVSFCVVPSSISEKPSYFSNFCNRLLLLQEISAIISACQEGEYETEKLFFSTLFSVYTVSDCLFRRLRRLLMLVSSDCIKLELLGGETSKASPQKFKLKSTRKGKNKGRSSNMTNLVQKSLKPLENPLEEQANGLGNNKDGNPNSSCVMENRKPAMVEACIVEKNHERGSGTVKNEMEHTRGRINNKIHISRKKGRKKNDNKSSNFKGSLATGNQGLNMIETAFSSVSVEGFDSCDNTKDSNNSAAIDEPCIGLAHKCSESLEKVEFVDICLPNLNKDDEIPLKDIPSGHNTGSDGIIESCISSDSLKCVFDPKTPLPFVSGSSHCTMHKNSDSVAHLESSKLNGTVLNYENAQPQRKGSKEFYIHESTRFLGDVSYEWPNLLPFYFPPTNFKRIPAATDRLHLDVGHNRHNHLHHSFMSTWHQKRHASLEGGSNHIVPQNLPMSLDWPPMVRGASRLLPSMSCSYDSGFISRLHSSFCSGFTTHGMQLNGSKDEDDEKYTGDFSDICDLKNPMDQMEDSESHWMVEDESECHAFSGRDYNQYFGGGVMYWNTSDPSGTVFSRPPSLSSEDSSWAWREADLNRAIDDMVGLPGLPASYSTNGLTSPPSGTYCSTFDQLGPGHHHLGYLVPGNDVSGNVAHPSQIGTDVSEENASGSLTNSSSGVEKISRDSHSYPMLRPIIVSSIAKKGSGSEFKPCHDHKSPCIPPTGRETPQVKRPPSPVVLCVPRAPRPPPLSPVGEPRKHRGFPTVRSGSSSPRHWGMRSWYNDVTNYEETRVCMDGAEVVWPSWGGKSIVGAPLIKPLPPSLSQDRLLAISQLALDHEHPDVALPLQPSGMLNCASQNLALVTLHKVLHEEIDCFCKKVANENLIRKPCINWAVKRVARSLQVLWPRSRTNIFGSNATGLALPTSDVDLVVCLPPVRNLEPIKEAGILEGRNGIKETCLQHAARYLANQEWVKSDSLKTIENTAIPVIMLVVEVPHDLIVPSGTRAQASKVETAEVKGEYDGGFCPDMIYSGETCLPLCSKMKSNESTGMESVRLDISFKSPSHAGLQTTKLVRELTEQFPATVPLALLLKQFLADRNLDHSYSGGLSSYCLVLLITRFLQHEHHIGRPINQSLGSLLMDFLYFFGNVFDPRQMRISIQGSGIYMNRERGYSIDPIHIDDPLYPTNNVGRNCFRIHQCIKAFADAYSVLENELAFLSNNLSDQSLKPSFRLLPKIIPSIGNDHDKKCFKDPV